MTSSLSISLYCEIFEGFSKSIFKVKDLEFVTGKKLHVALTFSLSEPPLGMIKTYITDLTLLLKTIFFVLASLMNFLRCLLSMRLLK